MTWSPGSSRTSSLVRRRDYLVNVLQSIFETLPERPSPTWICVCETHVFCDDGSHLGAGPTAGLHSGVGHAGLWRCARASQAAMSATGRGYAARPPRDRTAASPCARRRHPRRRRTRRSVSRALTSCVPRLSASRVGIDHATRRVPVSPPLHYPSEQFDGAIEISLRSTFEHPARRGSQRGRQRIVGRAFVAAVEQMPSRRGLLLVSSPPPPRVA